MKTSVHSHATQKYCFINSTHVPCAASALCMTQGPGTHREFDTSDVIYEQVDSRGASCGAAQRSAPAFLTHGHAIQQPRSFIYLRTAFTQKKNVSGSQSI